MGGNVKYLRLEPQDNKTRVSYIMLGNFFSITVCFFLVMFTILQILTSAKEITLVTWMLHAWTPLDHMYVNVMLDILEMDKTAQVNLIS